MAGYERPGIRVNSAEKYKIPDLIENKIC